MAVRKMIINAVEPEETRIAIVRDGLLEDLDVEIEGVEKNKGNIYKAKVIAVEPSLNAAFVDYGADKQGFLTANDVDPRLSPREHKGSTKNLGISDLLDAGQELIVQIEKDEVGAKGAVLTTYLSLAGRYLVLMPGSKRHGVSRRVSDEDERREMLEAAAELKVPDETAVIVRTAGADRSTEELQRDLDYLVRLWENMKAESRKAKAPALLYKDQDAIIRSLRDYFSTDIDEIILDSDEAYDRAAEYMHLVMPNQRSVLTRYVESRPIFFHYKIEEQIDAIYQQKVDLSGGGSLVIEPTEALVSIDVNSGKVKEKGQEETALQTNLEAAAEIARQVRLRDLGGIVVVDFIDMQSRRNRANVEKALRDAVRNDKARIKVGRISPNGTLEFTRQRIRSALRKNVFRQCQICSGTGHVLAPETHGMQVLRKLRDRASRADLKAATVRLPPDTENHIKMERWGAVQDLEKTFSIRVEIQVDRQLSQGQVDYAFETDSTKKPLDFAEPDFGPAYRPDGEPGPVAEDKPQDEEAKSRSASKRKRRTRKRGGGDTKRQQASSSDSPAIEFIDPEELLKGGDKKSKSDGRRGKSRRDEGANKKEGGKGRRRRGGKSRRPRPQAGANKGAPAAASAGGGSGSPAQAKKSANPISGFFKKLFGS